MAQYFPDRNAIMLKNRYYSHIRKNNLLESLLNELKATEEAEVIPIQAEITKVQAPQCLNEFVPQPKIIDFTYMDEKYSSETPFEETELYATVRPFENPLLEYNMMPAGFGNNFSVNQVRLANFQGFPMNCGNHGLYNGF